MFGAEYSRVDTISKEEVGQLRSRLAATEAARAELYDTLVVDVSHKWVTVGLKRVSDQIVSQWTPPLVGENPTCSVPAL